MRISVVLLAVLLTGCVSQSQTGGYQGDNFDLQQAAQTRISLGLTYLQNGNYQQAKVNLDRALEYAPRLADAHYSLAYYYQTVGEIKRADASYQDAMDLAPRNPDIANSYGAFLCEQADYERADDFFRQALNNQQYANSAATYENMAICSRAQGETGVAIDELQLALNHQPGRAKSLYMLTQLYVDTEQWQNAEATLKQYEKVARVSPASLQMAIIIAQGQGDVDTVEGYAEMLVTMYPASEEAKRWLEQASKSAKVVRKAKVAATLTHAEALPQQSSTSQQTEHASDNGASTTDTADASGVDTESTGGDENVKTRYHVVQQGENLYRISLKYNIKMAALLKWNELDNAGDIKVGTRLRLDRPE